MEFETKVKDKLQENPESEENFSFLSSFAQDAIIQINDRGLITYWNKSAERIFGLSETDVLNKSFHLLFAPERYLETHKKAFAKFRNSGEGAAINKTLELEGKRKNGEEFPIELSLSSFQVNGKWNAVGIIRDITKRKKLEQKLRDSEEELRNIFDNVNDAIYIRDLNGNFIDVNATACKRLGYEKKEFLQMHIRDINTPENIAKNPKLFNEKLSLVKDVVETVHLTKSGKKIPVEIHGKQSLYQNKPVIIAVSRDITKHKIAEKKLKESEKRFKTIFDNAIDGILIADKNTKKFTSGNKTICQMLGYSIEELKNIDVMGIHPKEDIPYVIDQFEKQSKGEITLAKNIPVKRKDGSIFYAEINSSLITLGEKTYLMGIFRDITKQKIAEDQLKESEETYHSLFSNSLSGIAFHKIIYTPNKEPINYMITDVNPMFEKILNLKKKNVINKLVTEAYGLEEPPFFEIYSHVAETMKSESFSAYFEPMDKYFKISAFSFERGKFITSFEDITEEKLLEIGLKDAHSELDEIFNLAIPICVIDGNYNITQANESLTSLFNLDNKNIIGKKCYDIWQEHYCNTPKCSLRRHMQGTDVIEYETEKEMGFDSKLSLLVKSTAHRSPNGDIATIYKSVMDITLRKRAEENLKKTLETTRKVLETLPMGIILADNNKTMQSVNKAALSLLGYKNEFEILGKNWYELTCPSEKNSYPFVDYGKERDQTEVSLRNKSGNEVPVLNSTLPITLGNIDYIMEAFVDITSLKEFQNLLKESQEKYLDLIETSTLGILDINLIENKIEYVNPALSDILECSLNDIKTKNLFYKNVHPEDISLLMTSREKKDVEFRILLRDGTTKWVAATRIYTYGINQQPINLRLWITDITDRKKTERLKEKFTEQLEKEVEYRTKDLKELLEKQRLYLDQIEKSSRFKTEFLATMSHELRTPLNAIIGFTDLLIEGVFGELNEEQSEYINDIDDSSKHLLDMITHILDISKIESGQATLNIEEIQLNNLIDQVISTLKPLYIQKDIKWELAGLKKEQFIFADRIKFKQIIYNLLNNAIKFTKKGKIRFEFKENKKDWEFVVKDTGIGISEKDFDIIFKDFRRVKSDYVDATQGTGLGLALTKRIINIHGGDISFNSKLEKGTTFTFNLPKTLKKKSTNKNRVGSFLTKL